MSNDYFKAQGWFKTYALNSQDSRGVFQELVKKDEEAFRLASAESDRIKAMMNEKYGPGTVKYGSEIKQPEIKTPQAAFEFSQRNPAAEGGRIAFGDGSITPVRNKSKNIVGKNLKLLEEGKLYHLRLGADKKVYFGTKKELETIFKNRKTSGGDVMARLEDVKDPEGFLTQKQFQEFLKKNNINAESSGSSFAKNHGVNTKVNPLQKNALLYDTSQFTEEFINKVQKAQVKSGVGTEFARDKFPPLTSTEKNKPRLDAIEKGGGVKKNDPYAGKRGSGIELGHTGNIFGTELITGDKLAYTPTEVNQLMGKKGNLDDKIRSVSAKIEKIKLSDKPANVVKDLLEQADNILIRLASQSQGFKKVTLSGGGTFGGDRLTIDPFNTYPGKTEKEIQKIQKEYLGKKIITEGPNKTPFEEIQKIQDAFFFEKNRKEVMKASKKIGKKEIKKITENINLTEIESYVTDTTGKVKQPVLSSGFSGAFEMLSDDLKPILNDPKFKAFKAAAKTPGKFFGIGDVVLGYLDYKNNIGQGMSEERAKKLAYQAMSFGAWRGGDKQYIKELKDTYLKQGGDESVFDQVIDLNKQNADLMQTVENTKKNYKKNLENEKTSGNIIGDVGIKYQVDLPTASEQLKLDLNSIKNKAENMDKNFTTFKETYTGEDLTKPSKDIKSAAFENLTKERLKAFDTKSLQSDTEVGPVWNYLRSNILNTQSIPRTITTAVDLINPFTPLPKLDDLRSDRARYEAQLKEMKEKYPREFYLENLQRGMDRDNPITIDAASNLAVKPELGINFSEGGITGLRSKYEYKK